MKNIGVNRNNGKCGIVDLDSNRVVIPYVFDDIRLVHNSALLRIGLKWGIISIDELLDLTVKMDDAHYLFFDTETTGVPKNYKAPISDLENWPRLVQLAWIVCDVNGNEISSKNLLVKPSGFVIPDESTRVHRITTNDALNKGMELSAAIELFIKDVKRVKYLVGHNVLFDINILGAELLRCNNDYKLSSVPYKCTMQSTIDYCKIPSSRPYRYKYPKLQELHKKLFGSEFEDAHDAMADIIATKKCFFELIDRQVL